VAQILDGILTLVVAALLLVGPGSLLAFAAGLRGWAAAGAGPVLTFGALVLAVVTATLLDLRWSPVTAGLLGLLVLVVTAAVSFVLRRRAGRTGEAGVATPSGPPDTDRTWSWAAVVGVSVAAVVGALAVFRGTDQLRAPNQGFDALFHVNVVQTILDLGDVSPSVTGTLNGYPQGGSVYPDALHAMAALIAGLHGTSVTAINAMMACIPLLLGLGLVALLRSLGLHREAVVAPLLLVATSGYPFDLIWRGPIWVYAFGISLIPSFLVLLSETLRQRRVLVTVALGCAAGGLALVHPSAALSGAVFAAFLVGQRWVTQRATFRGDIIVLVGAGVLAALVALPLIGRAVVDAGGGTIVDWPVVQTPGEALGGLLFFNYENGYPQLWLAVLGVWGIAALGRHRQLVWWGLSTLTFALLCTMAAAYEGRAVQLLTGPWWNDRFRFEGLAFLGLSVFCALGLVALADLGARAVDALRRRSRGAATDERRPGGIVAVVAVTAVVGVLTGGLYVQQNVDRLRLAYGIGVGGSVTAADLAAYDVLSDIADGGPVLNDPNDGSAWMWALADVRPVFGAALTVPVNPPLPPAREVLVDGLNCLDSSAEVRKSVQDLGVRYVFVASGTILGGPTPTRGFHGLADVRSLRPVYSEDGATIYAVHLTAPLSEPGPSCALPAAAD
jgi:hypothetical protein